MALDELKLNYFGPSGYTLNIEQRSVLQSSLPLLKKNLKLDRVQFWGKVFGTSKDYLIAKGYGSDAFDAKKTFISHDGITWVLLPEVDERTANNCSKIQGRFTGDASTESSVEIEFDQGGETKTRIVTVTEEKRLSSFIKFIDEDTSVVPRGAFTLTAEHRVIPNPTFQGLSLEEAQLLKNFAHLRNPVTFQKKSLLEKEGLSRTLDFLDIIDEDSPKGSWGIIHDRVSNMATIRSLLWPGYFAYHVANSPNFGSVYFGTGEKNNELGFML